MKVRIHNDLNTKILDYLDNCYSELMKKMLSEFYNLKGILSDAFTQDILIKVLSIIGELQTKMENDVKNFFRKNLHM